MRIIGGSFKGRRLRGVPRGVRPTTGRLRESLFNVLGARVEDSSWVDAFAGSGAIGIEALSRGARLVVFNDRNRKTLATVEANLRLCRIDTGFEVHRLDIFRLFQKLAGRKVDFVFLDPPHDFGAHAKLLKAVAGAMPDSWPRSLVLLEVYKAIQNDVAGTDYRVVKRIRAGDSHILILEREE